jgi:hypothetical protein
MQNDDLIRKIQETFKNQTFKDTAKTYKKTKEEQEKSRQNLKKLISMDKKC